MSSFVTPANRHVGRVFPFTPLQSALALAFLSLAAGAAQAQSAQPDGTLPVVTVTGQAATQDAARPSYQATSASMGPLGQQSLMTTPASVTRVPEELITNQQASSVNDALRFLPSVEIRDQQGYEASRPQARGFQGSIAQNTRLDGLNTVGTTAIAAENLSGIEVLNGLSGALYGPASPAGVFNYQLKRPTDTPLRRFVEGYDGKGVWTEQVDVGGRLGADDRFGYRLNAVHGEGESYVAGSQVDRTLVSADLDFRVNPRTVIEADFSHYRADATGLPGSIVYDTNKGANTSTVLPAAVDPTRAGYGQVGAGTDFKTDTGLFKVRHAFNDQWNLELGALYQDSLRNLFGITNTLQDNLGNYKVTKNFTAVPHFTIGSNLAYLHGQFDVAGLHNDFTFGTNGFVNNQYSYRNSIAIASSTVLNLADPQAVAFGATPANGGQYKSGRLTEQAVITADTLHFNSALALQAVLNRSDLTSESYNTTSHVTSRNENDGEYSPTVSLIYRPAPTLTTYATVAHSVEQGEQAPAGTANVNQFLGLYHDRQAEVGAKWAATDDLLLTVAVFHMTRPLATTDATTNIFAVAGTQMNNGVELFSQGKIGPALSIFGGVTYLDAKLRGTGIAATNDKDVVGVPRLKGDMVLDYHPDYAGGFALTGALHHEGTRAATNTNNSFAPAYTTLDAGIRYATSVMGQHHAALRLQVLNATDKRYYASIADGTIVGSPGANTAYLGTPRTVMASLELDY